MPQMQDTRTRMTLMKIGTGLISRWYWVCPCCVYLVEYSSLEASRLVEVDSDD